MRPKIALLSAPVFACAIFACAIEAPAQTTEQMVKPAPQNWLTYNGNYNSQRYSPLDQITAANAHDLQVKWVYDIPDMKNVEASPVVVNGVMYISQYNRVDAIDARTGNIIWRYQRQPVATAAQRGTTVYDNKVYVATTDAHLVALDARTGNVLWDVAVDGGRPVSGAAPFVAKGKVIVGGLDRPTGFLQAYDAETGKHIWTWYPIPKLGDPAAKTWSGDPQKNGGAAIWVSGSYDPKLNLIYYGTGQPNPEFSGEVRKGDNLYSDCIVAIDVDTGKLKWHFQSTPHDVHDWDAPETMALVDSMFEGRQRKLLLQANRNGFYYILDRTNGKFLRGAPFLEDLDWASGLTPDGRPILVPGHEPSVQGTVTCPSTAGATNWPSSTYDPDTRYFYVQVLEGCGISFRASSALGAGTGYVESPNERQNWQSYVRAFDAFTGKKVWEYKEIKSNHYGPGLLSTRGGIVFAGQQAGQVSVHDARSGESLWHFNTGSLITASPITYSIDGLQYLAIISNANVFAFSLPDASPQRKGNP